jgi:hypothetical protein
MGASSHPGAMMRDQLVWLPGKTGHLNRSSAWIDFFRTIGRMKRTFGVYYGMQRQDVKRKNRGKISWKIGMENSRVQNLCLPFSSGVVTRRMFWGCVIQIFWYVQAFLC